MFVKQRRSPRFRVGEMVRVRSMEAILASTLATNKLDGLLFTDQMGDYCGRMFRVIKVGRSLFNEHQRRTLRPRSSFYILEHAVCEGKAEDTPLRCDHSCFLLWHEDWLENIP
jgi:hypothetical protein